MHDVCTEISSCALHVSDLSHSYISAHRLVVPISRLSLVARRPGMTSRKTWHQQNHWPHFVASSRHLLGTLPDYLLDISWLSLVDLAVVPLLSLRPPKNCLFDWLIDWSYFVEQEEWSLVSTLSLCEEELHISFHFLGSCAATMDRRRSITERSITFVFLLSDYVS